MTTAPPIHVMLDLETWGTRPGCDLRSIGACVFDPNAGTLTGWDETASVGHHTSLDGKFYIATDNPQAPENCPTLELACSYHYDMSGEHGKFRTYPLFRDPATVAWWQDQSAEAQAAFDNPVDLKQALLKFAGWLCTLTENIYDQFGIVTDRSTNLRLWSHGPAFDPPILAAAFEAVGLPIPWHYRAPRDTRTAFDMAGIDDHSAFMDQFSFGTFHHALDDAICQARAVCAAYERLRPAIMAPALE